MFWHRAGGFARAKERIGLPFVFVNCIHRKVWDKGKILSRTAYVVLGGTVDGQREFSINIMLNEPPFSVTDFIKTTFSLLY